MPNFKNTPNEFVEKDGKTRWLSRSLAVVVTVILNGEKALIVKRGPKISHPDKWCNPCGYLDWDESGTQASMREVWEESGLDIGDIIENNPDSITFQSMLEPWEIVTNPELNHNQDVALYYGICIKSKKDPKVHIKNCEEDEILEAKWVKIDELKNYEFAFNHDKRIIKYLNYIKKNEN